MKTFALAGAVVLVAAAAGGYAFAVHEGRLRVAEVTEQVRSAAGPSGSFTYETSSVHPLSGSIELARVAFRSADGTLYTTDRLTVAAGKAGDLREIHAIGIRVVYAKGTLQAASFDASDVMIPTAASGSAQTIDPAAITFANAALHGASLALVRGVVNVSSIKVGSYGAGHPSTMSVSGASIAVINSAQFNRVDVGALQVAGVDLASLVYAAEHGRKPAVQSGQASLTADRILILQTGRQVLSIAKAELAGTSGLNQPTWSKLVISEAISTPTDAASVMKLKAIGLDTIGWDLTIAMSFKPDGGLLQAWPMTMTVQKLGTLEIGVDLAHVDLSALQRGTTTMATLGAALFRIELRGARARFVDGGALDLMLRAQAKKEGVDEEVVRQRLVDGLRDNAGFAAAVPNDQLRAVTEEFIARGGSVEIRLAPRPALSIIQLAVAAAGARTNPDAFLSVLGLSSVWERNDKSSNL